MHVLGIDIGGSAVKGMVVDTAEGTALTERIRLPLREGASPEEVCAAVRCVVRSFGWNGPVGCGFPAVVRDGIVYTAANIDPSWRGQDVRSMLEASTGCAVHVINDADAAGIAEMRFGEGRGHHGVVLVVTLGTGIGSALFVRGILVPNTELGHLVVRGQEAEHRASDAARRRLKLSWKKWGRRLDEYLRYVEDLLWPELIIVGGGVSRRFELFLPHLGLRTPVVPARLRNRAGMVGAAVAAFEALGHEAGPGRGCSS